MEDRHIVHFCPKTGIALLSVIDGHAGFGLPDIFNYFGWCCADHIKRCIATYVANHLKRVEINVAFSDILESSEELPTYSSTLVEKVAEELPVIMEQLKHSFVELDNDISGVALDVVKQFGGPLKSFDPAVFDAALSGACVNSLLLHGKNAFVANTGDCRSVLGRKENNKWVSVPLSTDHTYNNQNEVARITREHPGETHTLFTHRRLLGGLMPFRSFGDVSYKWKPEYLDFLVFMQILPGYYTPPYLTAEPEVSHRELTEDDKFIVLATDGLWERLSNEQVINIVGDKLDQHDGDNIATALLKLALGEDDDRVYELLTLTPPESRWFRDDITIIIVIFK